MKHIMKRRLTQIWSRGCADNGEKAHLEVHIHDKTQPKHRQHIKQQFIVQGGWFEEGRKAENLTNKHTVSVLDLLCCPQHGRKMAAIGNRKTD